METIFEYIFQNLLLLHLGTRLRFIWLRYIRRKDVSYSSLSEGSKKNELQQFENEMANRLCGCGFLVFVVLLIVLLQRLGVI